MGRVRRVIVGLGFGLVVLGVVRFFLVHTHPEGNRIHIQDDHKDLRKSHNRHGKAVSVGFCKEDDGEEAFRAERQTITRLVSPALPNRWIKWQNMTREGLPLAADDPYPDLSFCFSGDFANKAMETRFEESPQLGPPPNIRSDDMDTWKDGVYRPDDMMFVRHTKGRPLLIGLNTDPWRGEDCNHLDLIFDTKKQHSFYGCPSVYIPMALLNLLPSSYKPHHLLETTRTKSRALESLKEQFESLFSLSLTLLLSNHRHGCPRKTDSDNRKFCVMFCHPCRPHPVSGDGVILWTFLSVLEQEYKACDVIGDCQKAVDIPTYCGIWEREKYVNASVELYRSYRFVMAFETTQVDGYFTESVALAAIAGAVPVFWGDEGIGDRINEKRLVNINAHVSEEHVLKLRDAESISGDERITFAYNFLHQDFLHAVKHIRSLDEDYAKYQIKLTNSIIKEKSVDMSVLSPKRIAHAFRNILTDLDSYVTKEEE